jgi:hypothetical protein
MDKKAKVGRNFSFSSLKTLQLCQHAEPLSSLITRLIARG